MRLSDKQEVTEQSDSHMASSGRKTSKLMCALGGCRGGECNPSDDESDGEYLVWPCPLRISEHFTHVSFSSLWELWLDNNN